MTGPRPEREGAAHGAREPGPYAPYGPHQPPGAHGGQGRPDAFGAAVEGLRAPLADPLADPLPDPAPAGPTGRGVGTASLAVPPPTGRRRRARPASAGPEEAVEAARPPTGRRRARAAPSGPPHAAEPPVRAPETPPGVRDGQEMPVRAQGASVRVPETPVRSAARTPAPFAEPSARAPEVAETAVLPPVTVPAHETRKAGETGRTGEAGETVALRAVEARPAPADQTMPLRKVAPDRDGGPKPPPGGRAARRKAARGAGKRVGRHGSRARGGTAEPGAAGTAGAPRSAGADRPRTRMEAKRAARASKDSPGVVASRLIGELFITFGVLMLLFVTYQLWWTNIRAHQQANGAANNLQKKWDENGGDDRDPGVFSPGQGFAIIYIPKLDVKAPIAEGIDKHRVLDRGMVGHYGKSPLKTAMPWDKKGNFALAGHRNTHGEPFRYINRLKPGDKIVVETQNRYYTYEMSSILPQTPPSNTGVIKPVPPGSGFTKPGRYITLTTCTPEFTSTYRMIVWGKMVEERPRSEGKPDALVE
ncbi:class E sortase [Streptomyces sp. S465]|uniref:class E sortase n=1 Tax=Streptomyces sp. S465 TaxID=2979468 RepID=UPI0022A814D6|nr:class E sortase [Streptomyces sp. S465]WAP57155.1 class E sortase [Streptomyces sp. S465]